MQQLRLFFAMALLYMFRVTGQGNTSRTRRSLTAKGAPPIVTRLEARVLTGNNPRLNIHQHHGYNVHVTWTNKYFGDAYGYDCSTGRYKY